MPNEQLKQPLLGRKAKGRAGKGDQSGNPFSPPLESSQAQAMEQIDVEKQNALDASIAKDAAVDSQKMARNMAHAEALYKDLAISVSDQQVKIDTVSQQFANAKAKTEDAADELQLFLTRRDKKRRTVLYLTLAFIATILLYSFISWWFNSH